MIAHLDTSYGATELTDTWVLPGKEGHYCVHSPFTPFTIQRRKQGFALLSIQIGAGSAPALPELSVALRFVPFSLALVLFEDPSCLDVFCTHRIEQNKKEHRIA